MRNALWKVGKKYKIELLDGYVLTATIQALDEKNSLLKLNDLYGTERVISFKSIANSREIDKRNGVRNGVRNERETR